MSAKLAQLYLTEAIATINSIKLERGKVAKMLLQTIQAGINALSAILLFHHEYQNPVYSLSEMLAKAAQFEPELLKFKSTTKELDSLQTLPLIHGLDQDLKQHIKQIKKLIYQAELYLNKHL